MDAYSKTNEKNSENEKINFAELRLAKQMSLDVIILINLF